MGVEKQKFSECESQRSALPRTRHPAASLLFVIKSCQLLSVTTTLLGGIDLHVLLLVVQHHTAEQMECRPLYETTS